MTRAKSEPPAEESRRNFLKQAATFAGAAPLAPMLGAVTATANPRNADAQCIASARNSTASMAHSHAYQSLSPDEAGFVEAMVNIMCPADDLTPSGVDCGLAAFIDLQLAGGFGKGERLYMSGPWLQGKPEHGYQLPLSPEQFFKAGVAATNDTARRKFGLDFVNLAAATADKFLFELASGRVVHPHVSLTVWFQDIVYPLFLQACFADPIYGGNQDKVFWKMIGYPGLPALHTQDMTDYRGKPYPHAWDPKSIKDFS